MKKLGLVGGMGPQSTVPYYLGIVYGVQNRTSKDFFPNLTIESVNCFHILRLCGENKLDEITTYLLDAIMNLKNAGAEFAVLTANTSHIVFDRLQQVSPIPLLSIVESTSREAQRKGFKKIGLLGTVFTMTRDFYKKPFRDKDIEIVVPREDEMEYVDRIITSELEYGIVKPEALAGFQRVILRMRNEEGIEAIVLGCTELPLLLNNEVSPVECLDTVAIHTRDIIEEILS